MPYILSCTRLFNVLLWSLAASTLADLLCVVFDKLTVSHAKSFAGPLLPVPVLRYCNAQLCLCPDTQSIL